MNMPRPRWPSFAMRTQTDEWKVLRIARRCFEVAVIVADLSLFHLLARTRQQLYFQCVMWSRASKSGTATLKGDCIVLQKQRAMNSYVALFESWLIREPNLNVTRDNIGSWSWLVSLRVRFNIQAQHTRYLLNLEILLYYCSGFIHSL